jgi:hypothetical protein
MNVYDFLTSSGAGLLKDLLVPLLLAGPILAGRKHPRRTVLALSIGALLFLVAGAVGYDIVSGLRTSDLVFFPGPRFFSLDLFHINLALASFDALTFAYYLFLGASVLGLILTLQAGRRRWFIAILLSLALFSVIGIAPFDNALFLFSAITGDPFRPPFYSTLFPSPGAMAAFYVVMTALTAILPLPTLLYGLKGPDQPEARQAAPTPVAGVTLP